jgi:putative membrane protein
LIAIHQLPAFNAFFNALATICLVTGFVFVKKKNLIAHKWSMITALFFSAIFLVGYLVYHYNHGGTKFPELGWIKTVYLLILIPHIILAAVMVPMILLTFYRAFRQNWDGHKKIARITFPIWLYVSVTGVIIYFMVYHWFRI